MAESAFQKYESEHAARLRLVAYVETLEAEIADLRARPITMTKDDPYSSLPPLPAEEAE